MSGFTRDLTYRLLAQGRDQWEERRYLCASFHPHAGGDAYVRMWVEVVHPVEFPAVEREWTEQLHPSKSVQTRDLIERRTRQGTTYVQNPEKWMLREMIVALSRDEVTGDSAVGMVWTVVWQLLVKKRTPWLFEHLPEWSRNVVDQEEAEAV